jgi:hypothetical protein
LPLVGRTQIRQSHGRRLDLSHGGYPGAEYLDLMSIRLQ